MTAKINPWQWPSSKQLTISACKTPYFSVKGNKIWSLFLFGCYFIDIMLITVCSVFICYNMHFLELKMSQYLQNKRCHITPLPPNNSHLAIITVAMFLCPKGGLWREVRWILSSCCIVFTFIFVWTDSMELHEILTMWIITLVEVQVGLLWQ